MVYTLVMDVFTSQLESKINQMLANNWELYGNPFWNSKHEVYCQAMIKKEVKE